MRIGLVAVATVLTLLLFTAITYANGTSANSAQNQNQTTQQSMYGGTQTMVSTSSTVFPNAGMPNSYPGLAGGYWSPLVMPSGNAAKANSLLHLQDVIPSFVAKELASQPGGKVETHLVSFVIPAGKDGDVASQAPMIQPASFQVIVDQPSNQTQLATFDRMYQLVGINFIRGDDQASSFKILGTAISDGLKIGADTMTYVEGASLEMCASSWGIGISNSLSVVGFPGGSTGLGNVAAGGFGYTKARATYIEKPWMSVEYFKKRTGVTGFYSPSSTHPIVPAAGTLEMYPGPHVLEVSAPATPQPQEAQPAMQSANGISPTPVSTVSSSHGEVDPPAASLSDPPPPSIDPPKGKTSQIDSAKLHAVATQNVGWYR